jgi:hypothetical protein
LIDDEETAGIHRSDMFLAQRDVEETAHFLVAATCVMQKYVVDWQAMNVDLMDIEQSAVGGLEGFAGSEVNFGSEFVMTVEKSFCRFEGPDGHGDRTPLVLAAHPVHEQENSLLEWAHCHIEVLCQFDVLVQVRCQIDFVLELQMAAEVVRAFEAARLANHCRFGVGEQN